MLYALIEFLLGDEMYLEWLSKGILSSEMENHTIIVKSIEYPPLIIDPFGQTDQWIENYFKQHLEIFKKFLRDIFKKISDGLFAIKIELSRRAIHQKNVLNYKVEYQIKIILNQ